MISDELWEQWRALGTPLTFNVFETDIADMDDFDVDAYNPDFRDMMTVV